MMKKLKTRYAKKIVNHNFYGTIHVNNINTSPESILNSYPHTNFIEMKENHVGVNMTVRTMYKKKCIFSVFFQTNTPDFFISFITEGESLLFNYE